MFRMSPLFWTQSAGQAREMLFTYRDTQNLSLHARNLWPRREASVAIHFFKQQVVKKSPASSAERRERATRLQTGEKCAGIEGNKMGKKAWNCHRSVVCTLDVAFSSLFFNNFKKKLSMEERAGLNH